MRYYVTLPTLTASDAGVAPAGGEIEVDVVYLPSGQLRVTVGGQELEADVVALAGSLSARIGARVHDLYLEGGPPEVGVVVGAHRFYARVESERMRAASKALGNKGSGQGMVKSPMPGRVLKVLVSEGDEITTGMPLIVVEAMKMENELCAGRDGRIAKIFVAAGETVEGGARLIEIA